MFARRLPTLSTVTNVAKRLLDLYRDAGPMQAAVILTAAFDDQIVRRFDRMYGVRTSGFIELDATSFRKDRLRDATLYGPVNGWGLRREFRQLALSRDLKFADLGCGLGRACILAAEYGFHEVTGVELAPEFCAQARKNVAQWQRAAASTVSVKILEMDVLDYCDEAQDDVFFMFRPFSKKFFGLILDKLVQRAQRQGKLITLIYSERVALPGSFVPLVDAHRALRKVHVMASWGQAFHVYQCEAPGIDDHSVLPGTAGPSPSRP
jgi:SAM-dependent methyltransferase